MDVWLSESPKPANPMSKHLEGDWANWKGKEHTKGWSSGNVLDPHQLCFSQSASSCVGTNTLARMARLSGEEGWSGDERSCCCPREGADEREHGQMNEGFEEGWPLALPCRFFCEWSGVKSREAKTMQLPSPSWKRMGHTISQMKVLSAFAWRCLHSFPSLLPLKKQALELRHLCITKIYPYSEVIVCWRGSKFQTLNRE